MTSKPPTEPIKSSVISNDPAKTFYDPNTPWTNYWNIITGRMTSAGQIAFREDASIRNEKRDCNACEEWRDYLFKYSPMIVFMQKNIRELNGDLGPDNVICRRCPAELQKDGTLEYKVGGGFNPDRGIMICANQMRDRKHLEDTLAHEMIHAWDHLRWNINYNNLRHMACMEIRAQTLSGECRWTREFFTRQNWNITQQHQRCVRKRAILSVLRHPNCKDDLEATRVVNEVWDSCYNDTRPFDEIYR